MQTMPSRSREFTCQNDIVRFVVECIDVLEAAALPSHQPGVAGITDLSLHPSDKVVGVPLKYIFDLSVLLHLLFTV